MGSKFWPKRGSPGILHHYTETLTTFEFSPPPSEPTSPPSPSKPHTILFLGGLGDGLASTSYVADLVTSLAPTEWSLFSPVLSSSYSQWGFSHLDRDTDEIAMCIRYIQDYKKEKYGAEGKVVLFGHSTGSQMVLHYLSRPNPHTVNPVWDPYLEHVLRPAVDGAMMQAPVSDREAVMFIMRDGFLGRSPAQMKESYEKLVGLAREAVAKGGYDSMLPIELTSHFGYPPNTPVSCRRFLSLVSPDSPGKPGEDDMFSSDLGEEQLRRTFGMIKERALLGGRLCVLMSGADQSVPEWVDKEEQLRKWQRVADGEGGEGTVWDKEYSGIIPGASHALSNDDQAEPRRWLCRRMLEYLGTIAEVEEYELVGR